MEQQGQPGKLRSFEAPVAAEPARELTPDELYALDVSRRAQPKQRDPNRLWNAVKEDPLIPIGMATTVAVLVGGLTAFKQGNKVLSQKFMRARVVAQGATALIVAYSLYQRAGQPAKASQAEA
eukprot:TRINITY_DN8883_c2_g1_i1.p1 TRINITY_DN8883_c2_g1~~TRINITY_DN8883_c2_g1_i1.p1  ORF type:complete len:123 (-),score=35.71 TRINITY_DN8883_c2_g1_i1:32-400(-)